MEGMRISAGQKRACREAAGQIFKTMPGSDSSPGVAAASPIDSMSRPGIVISFRGVQKVLSSGSFENQLSMSVPKHGAILLRMVVTKPSR